MNIREEACEYALLGLHVIPLEPRGKRPYGLLVPHGIDEATCDPDKVLTWWEPRSKLNIGIVCHVSGLVVIDVDPRNGGFETFGELKEELGSLPPTPLSLTGGGGEHWLFRAPENVSMRGKLGEGVDVKNNGYIVAPPSIHPSGREYEWAHDQGLERPIHHLPEPWLHRISRPLVSRRKLEPSSDPLLSIPADYYIEKLTGREAFGRWMQCPFHKNGQERTPSLKVDGSMWACFGACEPLPGKVVMGGNVFDFAAVLWDYPYPLIGPDVAEVRARLERALRD